MFMFVTVMNADMYQRGPARTDGVTQMEERRSAGGEINKPCIDNLANERRGNAEAASRFSKALSSVMRTGAGSGDEEFL